MKSCVLTWNNALFQQPYLLSCTSFDVWNYDTSNVVYIVSLVVSAWFLPLIVITKCYSKACLVIISRSWFELYSFRLIGFAHAGVDQDKLSRDATNLGWGSKIRSQTNSKCHLFVTIEWLFVLTAVVICLSLSANSQLKFAFLGFCRQSTISG